MILNHNGGTVSGEGKKWEKKEIPADLVKSLAAKYNCDQLTSAR